MKIFERREPAECEKEECNHVFTHVNKIYARPDGEPLELPEPIADFYEYNGGKLHLTCPDCGHVTVKDMCQP